MTDSLQTQETDAAEPELSLLLFHEFFFNTVDVVERSRCVMRM